jgi:Fe-S-cluster-containing hydrogenase component 2
MDELHTKGVIHTDYLRELGLYPGEDQFRKGPVAVAECVERIPCNPCEAACKFDAIHIGANIADIPKINFDACVACGACVSACSGLAIFVLDKSYSDTQGTVSFPFEYSTNIDAGSMVEAVNRGGEVVCRGKVVRIATTKASDRTTVIKLEVPIEWVDEVRGIALPLPEGQQ